MECIAIEKPRISKSCKNTCFSSTRLPSYCVWWPTDIHVSYCS